MKTERDFAPRWSSPPSETINEILSSRGISQAEFSLMIDLPLSDIDNLLSGTDELSLLVARRLSEQLGASPDFWVARFCQYQDDIERVAAADWTDSLPIEELTQMGWVRKETDWRDRIDACLDFFGVPDFPTWQASYQDRLADAMFRRNQKVQLSPALVTWLRMGELAASKVKTENPWNAAIFEDSLEQARALTRLADPKRFIPRLAEICEVAGVILLVIRAPSGCQASGVSRFIDGRPIIQMSARYLSDDHFWFTFFHEAAHVIRHGPDEIFIDELDYRAPAETAQENEADTFASQTLLPLTYTQLKSLPRDKRSIINTARKWGISPGILIGQLQHHGIIAFSSLNGYKRRYRWSGAILEKA